MHLLQDGLHRVQELARSGLLLRWCPNSFMVMNIPVEVLKSERLKRNYTQEYIADKLGVSPSRVSRWETGRTEMKVSEMERYAAVIGIDPSMFYALCASFANSGATSLPIARIDIDIFTETGYAGILKMLQDLGIRHLTVKDTKQYLYGNNSNRKPGLS